MDQSELDKYRQRLIALRAELGELEKTSTDATKIVKLDQSSVGRLSRMDAMQRQQMALETARRREQQLKMIDGALRRIASGDYGYCFVCDEEIDTRRLEVDPTTTRCLKCKAA